VFAPCATQMWAVAQFSPGSGLEDAVQKFDIDLCGDDGAVCVRLRGFNTRTLDGAPSRVADPVAAASDLSPAKAAVVAAQPASPPVTDVVDTEQDPLQDKIKRMLIQSAARQLKLTTSKINSGAEMSSYGFDSLMLSDFVNMLNKEYRLGLAPTVFFEHTTLESFAHYLSEQHRTALAVHFDVQKRASPAAEAQAIEIKREIPAKQTMPAKGRGARTRFTMPAAAQTPVWQDNDPIAIIGMSGCFPMADNIEEFWANLVSGKDCMREVPPDRWDWRDYYGDPAKEANKTNIKWGGFIDSVGDFDPLFFGISPKEAEMMDPQQRLLMLHVWNAIEDAGYAPASLAGSSSAIFAGTASTGYSRLVFRAQMAIEGYMNTGAAPSVGPNRMSYFLDLHGPSEPIETACSSSLVAIRRGMEAIQSGECGLAIAGGVNTIVNPDAHVSFSKAGMLCEDGRCKTFSDKANGYARGEGVAMLVLKRLSEAERDGDHIYGLIRGAAENHGGRANSLTAPNPKAQAEVIKSAFRQAGVDPRTVGYIEAHGTGTSLGDPVEVNGLKAAFRDLYAATGDREVKQAHCGIGSVKTNIGHLEMAAGVAGVIKVLLQMQHGTLAPSLHCETLNPYIELKGSPFYVVREKQEWRAPHDEAGRALPRRGGVSSFGFGGVNALVILEVFIPLAAAPAAIAVSEDRPAVFVLSAR
ncbi:MAG: type I polyketide synthase, partial [Alphaproteobacteria bacterium]